MKKKAASASYMWVTPKKWETLFAIDGEQQQLNNSRVQSGWGMYPEST